MSLAEAAATDSRLDALRALRDRLAAEIDTCDSKRDMASLSQRFMDVVEQIADLTGPQEAPKETGLSDFEKRLREREKQAAKTPRRSGSSGNVRRSSG